MCKLCGSEGPLRESHIIPKFIGKWMKDTSLTPYLRYSGDINKRLQDLFKMKLLCDECEKLFSKWETKWAGKMFHPLASGAEAMPYGCWMLKFATSLSWRALQFFRDQRPEDYLAAEEVLDEMQRHLSKFILEGGKDLGQYTHHIYAADVFGYTAGPSSINQIMYLRSIDIDLVKAPDLSEVYLYIKLPLLILVVVVVAKDAMWLDAGRIRDRGTFFPKRDVIDRRMWPYIFRMGESAGELMQHTSEKSVEVAFKALRKRVEEDPEKVADSELFRSLLEYLESLDEWISEDGKASPKDDE